MTTNTTDSLPRTEAGRETLGTLVGYATDRDAGGVGEMEEAERAYLALVLAIEEQAAAEARRELLVELHSLPWTEWLHDLDGTQHYITHEVGYDGDDVEGVACITGPEGHQEDADALVADLRAALSEEQP